MTLGEVCFAQGPNTACDRCATKSVKRSDTSSRRASCADDISEVVNVRVCVCCEKIARLAEVIRDLWFLHPLGLLRLATCPRLHLLSFRLALRISLGRFYPLRRRLSVDAPAASMVPTPSTSTRSTFSTLQISFYLCVKRAERCAREAVVARK